MPPRNPRCLAAAIAAGLIVGASADAGSVTLTSVRDNTLIGEPDGLGANGSGDYLFAGITGMGGLCGTRRGMLFFDVASNLPAGAQIETVSLRLYMSRTNIGPRAVTVHRVNADWGEGASDAPGEEGGGALAETDDATWLHTFFDDQFWSVAGGDYNAEPSTGVLVDDVGFYVFSSSTMAADVQSWIDDPSTEFGWMLKGDESQAPTSKRFNAREHGTASLRPQLSIAYAPPPPCPTDTDGNFTIDVDDLINVIIDWGTTGAANGGDVDGSGAVDVDDLVRVILDWGPCAPS